MLLCMILLPYNNLVGIFHLQDLQEIMTVLLILGRTITTLMQFITTSLSPPNSIHTPDSLEPGQFFDPVIFDPYMKIKLSRSTYRVTSFTNFTLYFVSFNNSYAYLNQFKADLSDPEILGPSQTWGGEKAMTDIQEMI